jgi:uncharacterized membrane protein YqgA involved in biofilm formation
VQTGLNPLVIASALNSFAILLGSAFGLASHRQIPPHRQKQLQVLLGASLVIVGLHLTVSSLHGSFRSGLLQAAIIVLSLMLGRFTGSLLGLQRLSNHAGRSASRALLESETGQRARFGDGFAACTTFFALAPLAIIGPLIDGLSDNWHPLAAKSLMDGLAAISFARTFGPSAAASALPVFVWQGTCFLLAQSLRPFLESQSLLDPIAGVAGLLVFMVALVALGLRRIRLADYLPSLLYAPLLTRLLQP